MALAKHVGVVNERISPPGGPLRLVPNQSVDEGLGWFSIALGLGEVFATRMLSNAAGIDKAFSPVVRLFGVREITSGVGLLRARNKKPWIWSRVVGDVLDLGFVGLGLFVERRPGARRRLWASAAVVAPIVVLDLVQSFRKAA